MLSQSRIVLQGNSAYEHEQEGLVFLRGVLPDTDPYLVWELVELLDPSTGRLLEIDAIVLGYSALYVVEMKGGPGIYEGDSVDWYRTPRDAPRRYMDPPLKATNWKSKVLKGLIQAKLPRSVRCPWVQPLVFLSHQDVETRFRSGGDVAVVTRKCLLAALKNDDVPGVEKRERERVNGPQMRAVAQALDAIGVRASKGVARVGTYELLGTLEEGPGYQDRQAVHADNKAFRRRARIYLVPQQTSVERRQQLRREADREARLLEEVKDHPNVLRLVDYVTDSPLGPTVLFDAFDGVPLDAFLRSHPDLGFGRRIELIEQVGRALHHCHRKSVLHGALAPSAVLVREGEGGALHAKLYNFQQGEGAEITPSLHPSELADAPWALYQAPELRDNPGARGPVSDVFSLGALSYLVLTGHPPAASIREMDERLARDHRLEPTAAADGLPELVAKQIGLATESKPINRADDVHQWLEELLEFATAPDKPDEVEEVSPLLARSNDILGNDLLVVGVLGQGASSRVLEVDKEGRAYALKVALTPDDDPRLAEEARTLQALRHARIVQHVDTRQIGGRTCILMAKAGDQTLQRYLVREGAVSLDYASRFGEDLLLGLEELEERQILHRDIKPANLGVGAVTKKAHHLTLFDFSLALDLRSEGTSSAGRTQLGVGTAVYRDPFLRLRGAWDSAADRWSAAITLHELMTGVRPGFSSDGAAAVEADAVIVLAAERFEASVRDQLVHFFTRALHRDVEARFESAAVMRKAWNRCFEQPTTSSSPVAAPVEMPPEVTTDEALASIQLETPIESLPLSVRARNALDRAGLTRAVEVLQLPDNRLSAVRGVGRLVAKEIFDFRDRWKAVRTLTPEPGKPFFPGYRGEDIHVTTAGLPPSAAAALRDGGLLTLATVAHAPERHVEVLAARGGVAPAVLWKALEAENTRSNARQRPTTLEGWIDALLPPKKGARTRNLRVLFGLAEPLLGKVDVPVAEVARVLGMTPANLYIQLGKERDQWAQHGAFSGLVQLAEAVVTEAGGAVPARKAAEALCERIPSDGTSSREVATASASALLRIVTQVERDDAQLAWERLASTPWLLASSALAPVVKKLGELADELAGRPVLASPGEVARLLSAAVEGTPLASLPPERLTELAAQASTRGERSARLEIYPRGLEPSRALALSSSVLTGNLTPAAIQQRVTARYPSAAPLPDHPELDALLVPLGLKWDEDQRLYARPGEPRTTQHTSFTSGTSLPSLPSWQQALDPRYIALDEFEERLRITLDRRTLKVLGILADRAREAALALTEVLGIRRISLDAALSDAMHAVARDLGVTPELIYRADHEGPRGADWPELRQLAQRAATQVASELLPAKEPLLLVQPGLVARYRLHGFLRELLDASRDPKCAALFLLVPSHDTAGVPRINGDLTIPEVGLPQTMWIPLEWVREARRRAA